MSANSTRGDPDQLAYSIPESATKVNVSRAEMYNRLNRGDLRAKKLGRRTVILHDDLMAYLVSLPDYVPAAA